MKTNPTLALPRRKAQTISRWLKSENLLATSLLEEPVTNLQVAGAAITTLAITGLLFAASCPLTLLVTLPLLAIGANLIKKGGAL